MSELKKLRTGDKLREFPGKTFNALVEGEEARRRKLSSIDDPRSSPKQKSPVIVKLVWDGAAALAPGNVVKLGNAVFDPSVTEWAPFQGLAFYATAFGTGDSDKPYAIALEPIAAKNVDVYGVGYGVIPEAYWAKVNVTDAAHTYATRPASGTVMSSAASGDKIIWRETGTGEKWAVVAMGGTAEKFRLIRGRSVGVQSGTTILLDNVVVLAGGLDPSDDDPAAQVTVLNLFSQSYADNEWVDAIYSPGASASPAADWETLKSGSSTGSPLQRFELTSDKFAADEIAYGRFLDDDGNMVGDEVLLYDPMRKFYGKTATYYGDSYGFRGIALQRSDLGGVEDDRWEIVNMEGFADWVVLEYAGSPDNEWQLQSFGNTDPWNYKQPAENGAPLTLADPLGVVGTPQAGDKLIAVLTNPDTSPPTYQVREREGSGKKTAIVKSSAIIAAAVDSGTRIPEESTDFATISGDTFSSVFNWSLVEIAANSYMVILEIDRKGVIVTVFC